MYFSFGAMFLSVVCDCGISWLYSLEFGDSKNDVLYMVEVATIENTMSAVKIISKMCRFCIC